jgi:putative MATE family efflux protein
MSLPMVVSMLVQACYNVVDSVFVAQINENALTAVSLAFPVQMLMVAFAAGTGVGLNAFLSRSLGERNFDRVNRTAINGVFLALASSVPFLLFGLFFTERFFLSQTDDLEIVGFGHDYLSIVCMFSIAVFSQIAFERLLMSTGLTIYSMLAQIAGAVTNIILDPIMIFGLLGFPAMGMAGAALATVIGQTLAAALAIYFNLRFNHEIEFKAKGFRPDGQIIKGIYAVGAPSILMMATGSGMTYCLNLILISFTPTATAVFGIYFRLQSLLFLPILGLNNGMVPMVAYNFGAGNKNRIVQTIRLAAMYAEGIMFLGVAAFELFPDKLLQLFNASEGMLAIGIPALRIIGIHYLLAGFCLVFISTLQALGNGLESLIIAITRQLGVLLPAAWLLSLTGSVTAVWWAFPLAEGVTLALSGYLLKNVFRQKVDCLIPRLKPVI